MVRKTSPKLAVYQIPSGYNSYTPENERLEFPKMMGLGKGDSGFKYGHCWYPVVKFQIGYCGSFRW